MALVLESLFWSESAEQWQRRGDRGVFLKKPVSRHGCLIHAGQPCGPPFASLCLPCLPSSVANLPNLRPPSSALKSPEVHMSGWQWWFLIPPRHFYVSQALDSHRTGVLMKTVARPFLVLVDTVVFYTHPPLCGVCVRINPKSKRKKSRGWWPLIRPGPALCPPLSWEVGGEALLAHAAWKGLSRVQPDRNLATFGGPLRRFRQKWKKAESRTKQWS